MKGAENASCVIPPVNTKVILSTDDKEAVGYFKEGYAFSPMLTLGMQKSLGKGDVFTTWLKLQKAD